MCVCLSSDFVVFGDSGQGDVLLSELMMKRQGARAGLKASFIHNVRATSSSALRAASPAPEASVWVYGTSIGAAMQAFQLGLLSLSSLIEVAEQVVEGYVSFFFFHSVVSLTPLPSFLLCRMYFVDSYDQASRPTDLGPYVDLLAKDLSALKELSKGKDAKVEDLVRSIEVLKSMKQIVGSSSIKLSALPTSPRRSNQLLSKFALRWRRKSSAAKKLF